MEFINDLIKYIPFFLPAAWMTLKITVLGILIGLILGLVMALLRLSDKWWINLLARVYIYVIRGTPLLLQLFFLFYVLRQALGLDSFTAAFLALGVHNGAYIAEIFRGAIQSIESGQMEAARSLGMTYFKALRRIILPQALKRSIPPLGNQFIIALKDSSLASAITINEVLLQAQRLAAANYKMLEMLTVAAIFYLFYTSIFTLVVNRLEFRLDVDNRLRGQEA
ncbi:MAG TPA: amino acid ABC transporter permease [Syntrophomonadaceae bacterium]|nr:amino acid ABC transporter permease [Syntrophomonadaceae bacterium]HNX29908.1 amino acid ABC transporter permease [Syntrophomonadaceae bacterium]HPR94548.1 amino acid ABC transporter permease [Syntrophomonadaceae bacterium]